MTWSKYERQRDAEVEVPQIDVTAGFAEVW